MNSKIIHEPWRSFLLELDSIIDKETSLHCFGGFVVTEVYGAERKTRDVDVISIVPKNLQMTESGAEGSALHRKYGVYLDRVGIATVPENYEDRLSEIYHGTYRFLRLMAFDPYDLALAKIERNIERDREDVKHLASVVPFDLEILKGRYFNELRPYLGNPEREDLTLKLWVEMIEELR